MISNSQKVKSWERSTENHSHIAYNYLELLIMFGGSAILIWLGLMLAGFIGALTGLCGGVVIVPMMILGFGVGIRYTIGASLVSLIATSSGAAAAYVGEGFSNIRIRIANADKSGHHSSTEFLHL